MLKKIKKGFVNFKKYISTNILMCTFIGSTLINGIILRFLTVQNFFAVKPIFADLTFLLLITSIAYFIKPKDQFKYFLPWSIILTFLCIGNCIYYSNYISFASVSLLKTAGEMGGYLDAFENIFKFWDLIFLWQIFAIVFTNRKLKKRNYYEEVKKVEVPKTRFLNMIATAVITLGIFATMVTSTDLSRFNKQWNRSYIVMSFGIYTYQANDIVASIRTTMNEMFGYDEAYKTFREYYESNNGEKEKNKYSNIFEGKNVIAIHGESLQGFLMNLKFNGKELTPNLNKLAREGIYFSNFYSQESVGNSSDSEFTSLTSLLPSSSGTVFMNYFNRDYETILKALKEKDYYTFSMHANNGSAWNRMNAYKYLGYDNFYYYTKDYDIDEVIGLGLSDKSFFKQSVEKIKKLDSKKTNWYGTLVMLSNHTPFNALEDDTSYSVDYITTEKNANGEVVEVVNKWLEHTKMGNYLKSAHYADEALGELMKELEEADLLDDTIIMLYGDHDCKLKQSEFKKLYESEYYEDVLIDKTDTVGYIDDFTYELNTKVPFLIWSKDKVGTKYNKEYTDIMGMMDVAPTLANMLGVNLKYNLGHDYFSNNNHIVVFPDGNWMTKDLYYNASNDSYRQLDLNISVSLDEITKNTEYAEELIKLSNGIITYDLIGIYEEQKELQK